MLALEESNIAKIYQKRFLGKSKCIADTDIQYRILRKWLRSISIEDPFVLDAGCGNGKYSFKLQEQGYSNIFSLDLYAEPEQHGKIHYCCASIAAVPFPENYFDLIYSYSVIFYLENPEQGFIEFKRLLKKGGYLIITVHSRYSIFTLIRSLKRLFGFKSVAHLQDVSFYSASYYRKLLEKNDYEVINIDGYGMSVIFYPVYKRISHVVGKLTKISLPQYTQSLESCSFLAKIRSIFGYHIIIVARKR